MEITVFVFFKMFSAIPGSNYSYIPVRSFGSPTIQKA